MRYTWKIRLIDRHIGTLVLFLFSIFHLFRRHPKVAAPKNVLIIELVEMGASIMGYSSLKYIKRQVPNARIFVLCTESTKEPWMLLDTVDADDVIALDNASTIRLLRSIWRETRRLSKMDIDMVIDFELFTRISAIISFLVKAKRRAGFYGYTMGGLYRGEFLDVKCNFNQNMHISKNLLALTKSALDPHPRYYNWEGPIHNVEIEAPVYASDADIKSRVEGKVLVALGRNEPLPLILVAPTVGQMLPMRDYPKEQYLHVIHKLLAKYPHHSILLVGTKAHESTAAYIEKEAHDRRCVNFCGQTATFQELLELFGMAELLITNDSGNPHFAAMVGLKNVALYGPETPFMYGPLGKSVCLFEFFHSSPSITTYNHKNPPTNSNASLRAIAPDRVVDTAVRVMDGSARYLTVNGEMPYLL